jgi:hypothetical protein
MEIYKFLAELMKVLKLLLNFQLSLLKIERNKKKILKCQK